MKNPRVFLLRYLALPLLLAFYALTPALAFPSPNVSCPLSAKDSETFLTLDQVTPQIVRELQRRFGNPPGNGIDMAPRDHDWQVTDVITSEVPLSFRRFVQAGHEGSRWYVWYEMGGMGHSYHIAIFDLPEGAVAPRLLLHTAVNFPEQLCSPTMAHLHDTTETPEPNYMW
jgi:hypothetical protein